METEAFERAVVAVDGAVDACRGQLLTASEFGWVTVDALLEYLETEDPRDDVEHFIAYAVDWADALGDVSLFADQTLPSVVERRLRWCLNRQELRLRFDQLLFDLKRGLAAGWDDASLRLREVCREGTATHRPLFRPFNWGGEIVALAARFGDTRALFDALDPTAPDRLASPRRDQGQTYFAALDHLGHLAASPVDPHGIAESARDRLVELAGFLSMAGDASIRLPAHLVGEDQASALLEHYERRCSYFRELEAEDPPLDEDAERQTAVLRSVLFQIQDARRLREEV